MIYIVIGAMLGAILLLGAWEYQAHRRNLRLVPLRIHVNGTRGKSSVTRLIASGLRAGGIRTCAKTTGSAPRMILEDGSEYSIQRQGRANIIEQPRAVAVAARRGAQAVVLECMAINPRYQVYCEDVLVKSTIGVITNVRADHLDVMGPTVEDVAKALAGTAPKNGVLVTAETNERLLSILRRAAEAEHSTLVCATPKGEGVSAEELRGFSYLEHPENVAVALKVCALAGVDRARALAGMFAAEPDVGVLRVVRLAFFAKEIDFINAFAANDPDSTLAIWNLVLDLFPGERQRVALLNCRADRVHRSVQLGEMLPKLENLDRVVIAGTGTRVAVDSALDHGLDPEKLVVMEEARADDIFERSVAQIARAGVVFGIGNIGGIGHNLIEYFQNRAAPPQPSGAGA